MEIKASVKKEEQVRDPGVWRKRHAQLNRKAVEQRQGRLGWAGLHSGLRSTRLCHRCEKLMKALSKDAMTSFDRRIRAGG